MTLSHKDIYEFNDLPKHLYY